METTDEELTWDHFIARQVQAALAGEVVTNTCYAGAIDYPFMDCNIGIRGPKGGMVWQYCFGPRAHPYWYTDTPYEFWWVNLTQRKVLRRERYPG